METTTDGDPVAVSRRPGGRADRPIVAVDVARAAGVSQKTVSRVVNGDPQVGDELRGRVLRAIDELDYRPNRAAQNLVLGHTKTIGVLSLGTTDFGPSALLVATARAVRAAGYVMSVVNTIEPNSLDGAPLDNASATATAGTRTGAGMIASFPSDVFGAVNVNGFGKAAGALYTGFTAKGDSMGVKPSRTTRRPGGPRAVDGPVDHRIHRRRQAADVRNHARSSQR